MTFVGIPFLQARSIQQRVFFWSAGLGALATSLFLVASEQATKAEAKETITEQKLVLNHSWSGELSPDREFRWKTETLDPSALYSLSVSVDALAFEPEKKYRAARVSKRTLDDPLPDGRGSELSSRSHQSSVTGHQSSVISHRHARASEFLHTFFPPENKYHVALEGPGRLSITKALHSGDPGLFFTFRPRAKGPAVIHWRPELKTAGLLSQSSPLPLSASPALFLTAPLKLNITLRRMELAAHEQLAFEAEPNDSWQDANPLVLGRTIYGGSDDVEYLDNQEEYKVGWDWFRIDFNESLPKLVFFELDLPDRDLPLQLLFYRFNAASGSIEPYTRGKDPMEVLHDGQKIRYSKFISRVLTPGRYYLAVLGNHPFYLLRSTVYPVPPYKDPRQAVETAMHYMLGIGDAWFAQIPRLGSRYRRSIMLHDEAERCTACHPTVFPLESSLTAFKNGYPIRAKSQFRYLMDRVYNAPTPLYGNRGVNWVRFVAIELQFFGKQGGLVLDYENLVTRRSTPLLGRFTGFLQAAWDHRNTLPEDENNGVSPLDSKFGFAWRDWRVLDELARRTSDSSLRVSADNIRKIFASADSVKRLEGTQDRLHRLYGLALMDRRAYGGEINEAVRYFLDRQNDDGGWPGNEEKPAGGDSRMDSTESVEYLTGQTIHTLLQAGVDGKERNRLEKAAGWLLSRQQEFGGWFQTETIENFVTPMRETRYAIMALSSLYPASSNLGKGMAENDTIGHGDAGTRRHGDAATPGGLGNRDGKPARLPRAGALLDTLDDLDNLWEMPRGLESESRIIALLQHQNAWVRALTAQCLGRIGGPNSVEPLIGLLNDPTKMVWQSAAWALRQLGNRGIGVDTIAVALRSEDAATRRGASRIFAYQFYGMDQRADILEIFISLLRDPDLLTRHQAVRTLAQWWYRTDDREIRRRIFQAFIDQLADGDEHPLQRFNLSQGLYNLLDENLGEPGTGYGRWIAYLKPEQQEALRSERRWQEQEILLKPILTSLVKGPAPQRLGVLLGFDGTPFWRGYTTAAFGPGNDRAFDFERKQDFDGLGEAFLKLLSRSDQPDEVQYGLRLGAFFDVFRGAYSKQLAPLLLDAVLHPEARVRQAAAGISEKVSLAGIEAAEISKLIKAASTAKAESGGGATSESRTASLKLLRANPNLLSQPGVADLVRAFLEDPSLSSQALPLLAETHFSEQEALAALVKFWPRSLPHDTQEPEAFKTLRERNSLLSEQTLERSRLAEMVLPPQAFLDAIVLLEKRPALLDKPAVLMRLAGAARVDNSRVRQMVFELLARYPQVASNRLLLPLVQSALLDIRAEVRRAAVNLARLNGEILKFPEANDYLLRLLVDSDARVRKATLELVDAKKLLVQEPKLAGRVKALVEGERDKAVRLKAANVLRQAGLDPDSVGATANLATPALPDFELFQRTVNAYFYQDSPKDLRACANCHATHRILRLAEPPAAGQQLSKQSLQQNYRALLRVIDVNDPEQSLVLRKPLSPSGQGNQDSGSPTGLTHVGGTRWSGPDDPAFQAILHWIRSAVSRP